MLKQTPRRSSRGAVQWAEMARTGSALLAGSEGSAVLAKSEGSGRRSAAGGSGQKSASLWRIFEPLRPPHRRQYKTLQRVV